MKYIIEIDDEPVSSGEQEIYKATCFKTLVFDPYGLDQMEPADKALKEAEKQGIDKAWSLARKLEAANAETWNQIFGEWYEYGCLEKMSYENAQYMYDSWAAKKDEIHIGDEVVFYYNDCPGDAVVVTSINKGGIVGGICADGSVHMRNKDVYPCVKTGRTFPEVAKLIEAMQTR